VEFACGSEEWKCAEEERIGNWEGSLKVKWKRKWN
jgi:hypothetical protein